MNKQNLKKGSCFWGHKWTKWKLFKADMIHLPTGRKFSESRQSRTCIKCGKIQEQEIFN